jgi:MSHA biogenesis protein MshM
VYLQHFGLREYPFAITPDPEFVYRGAAHQMALNTVRLALASGEGFVKVTGEVGTGKTLLCRELLAGFGAEVTSAYVLNPRLTPRSLLRTVCAELGMKRPSGLDEHALYRKLEAELLQLAAEGRQAVLCIDEAQVLDADCMEALRLLTNLETCKRKLIQIVLFGQPELDDLLATPRIRSLASRIAFSARLDGLQRDDLSHYLQHRLRVAGAPAATVFSPAACWLLWHASRGVPRRINILAHKALMLAYGRGRSGVGLGEAFGAWTDGRHAPRWRLPALRGAR